MVTEDQVRTLFARANPVPDSGLITTDEFGRQAHLDAILERSSEMIGTETTNNERVGSGRRLTPWLVAAIVVIVFGTVALLTREGPTSPPVATAPPAPAPTTPAPTPEPVEPGVANVEAFIAYFNLGDVDGMIDVVAPGYPLGRLVNEEYAHHEELLFVMGTRWEVIEPCAMSGEGGSVECTISVTDDLFGPAGFDHTSTFVFDVDEQGSISRWTDLGCCERQTEYMRAFWLWLEAAHPEDYSEFDALADFTLPQSLPGYVLGQPSLMTRAVGYVDEFLAQSEVYPLDNP